MRGNTMPSKKEMLSKMLITSGFSFDGYRITKYSGYISGDDAISVDRGWAVLGSGPNIKDKLLDSLVKIRRNALKELKEAAYDLGCNAVIGVDFDYITLDPQTANLVGGTVYQPYVFCVTANGNAVIIEKEEDYATDDILDDEYEEVLEFVEEAATKLGIDAKNSEMQSFFEYMDNCKSCSEIKFFWDAQGYNDVSQYDKVTNRLETLFKFERVYGANEDETKKYVVELKELINSL